ncbi:MAG: hypothetical protein OXP71_11050 [Candidatus Poribacteria bacterium]|nr:hypothetical protein [Candidatus Poribacteria bacterium]
MNIEEHAWIQAIALWVKAHLIGIVVLSAITLILSMLSILALVIYLPSDYFTREKHVSIVSNRFLRILLRILKNIFGVIALLIGFVMLIGPGQGLLTILVGVILCDFPRKRRVERKLIGRPALLNAANKFRARYKRPPILLNDE